MLTWWWSRKAPKSDRYREVSGPRPRLDSAFRQLRLVQVELTRLKAEVDLARREAHAARQAVSRKTSPATPGAQVNGKPTTFEEILAAQGVSK